MVPLVSYHLHLGLIDHEDNFKSAVNGFGRFDSSSFSRCESAVFSIQLQYAKTILASCSSSDSTTMNSFPCRKELTTDHATMPFVLSILNTLPKVVPQAKYSGELPMPLVAQLPCSTSTLS